MKNKILKDIYNEIKIFLVDNSFVKQHIKISKFLTKAWIEKETDKKTSKKRKSKKTKK
jgi:hypothetical protein